MKKPSLGIVASAFFLALTVAPVHAFHCPNDVKAIDHALSKAMLSADQKAQVQKLRDEGDALHKSGAHKDSLGKLAEAMRIILNSM